MKPSSNLAFELRTAKQTVTSSTAWCASTYAMNVFVGQAPGTCRQVVLDAEKDRTGRAVYQRYIAWRGVDATQEIARAVACCRRKTRSVLRADVRTPSQTAHSDRLNETDGDGRTDGRRRGERGRHTHTQARTRSDRATGAARQENVNNSR